ncbi:MAG: hypothetical protein RL701_6667, partial [Pseudomonadota bacterium]
MTAPNRRAGALANARGLGKLQRAWRSLVLCFSCAACATRPPTVFFGDEKYLRFGVDPRDEANALIRLYAEQGEPVALRLSGHDFTAVGFMD